MVINHNMSAINAQRQMYKTSTAQAKSTEKLSSGLRINRAGDDAAGLAISEKMRGQISGLNQASRNAQDGISLIQTAEGAMDEQHSMLQRMRELAVQAEISQLQEEITAITEKTEFNTKKLLNGNQKLVSASGSALLDSAKEIYSTASAKATSLYNITNSGGGKVTINKLKTSITQILSNYETKLAAAEEKNDTLGKGGVTFQVGANAGQTIRVGVNGMTAEELGVDKIDVTQPSTGKGEMSDIAKIDRAINSVSHQRAKLGAVQNRLEHTIANVDNSAENLQAAESRVRDTDMAKEMMNLTSKNVLAQATQSMLAQANQRPNQVLSLLQ